jgi:hypothetical protein
MVAPGNGTKLVRAANRPRPTRPSSCQSALPSRLWPRFSLAANLHLASVAPYLRPKPTGLIGVDDNGGPHAP